MDNDRRKMGNGERARAVRMKYRLVCRQMCWIVEITVKENCSICVIQSLTDAEVQA